MTPEHRAYLEGASERIRLRSVFDRSPFSELGPYRDVALLLALLDLGPAHEVLARCYSRRAGGRPPKDPVAMLRCFVLMGALGEAAVNAWVARLSKEPILAILSGFEPRARPGDGTF